jgi:hypothetical protein
MTRGLDIFEKNMNSKTGEGFRDLIEVVSLAVSIRHTLLAV